MELKAIFTAPKPKEGQYQFDGTILSISMSCCFTKLRTVTICCCNFWVIKGKIRPCYIWNIPQSVRKKRDNETRKSDKMKPKEGWQSHCKFFVVGSFLLLLRKHNRIARFFYCLFILIAFKKTKKFHSCLIWCMIFLVWNLSWIPFHHFQSLELLKWKIELARKIYFHVQLKLGHNRPLDSTKHLNKRVL